MASKSRGGGSKAFLAGPLKKYRFFTVSLRWYKKIEYENVASLQRNKHIIPLKPNSLMHMLPILDGRSENDAHVWSENNKSSPLMHLFTFTSDFFKGQKLFHSICAQPWMKNQIIQEPCCSSKRSFVIPKWRENHSSSSRGYLTWMTTDIHVLSFMVGF